MRTHLSIDIGKAIKWPDKDLENIFSDAETGKSLPASEVRDILTGMLKEGKEKFPCGNCETFDYITGCPGHPQNENMYTEEQINNWK
jgi:hypothetical protein